MKLLLCEMRSGVNWGFAPKVPVPDNQRPFKLVNGSPPHVSSGHAEDMAKAINSVTGPMDHAVWLVAESEHWMQAITPESFSYVKDLIPGDGLIVAMPWIRPRALPGRGLSMNRAMDYHASVNSVLFVTGLPSHLHKAPEQPVQNFNGIVVSNKVVPPAANKAWLEGPGRNLQHLVTDANNPSEAVALTAAAAELWWFLNRPQGFPGNILKAVLLASATGWNDSTWLQTDSQPGYLDIHDASIDGWLKKWNPIDERVLRGECAGEIGASYWSGIMAPGNAVSIVIEHPGGRLRVALVWNRDGIQFHRFGFGTPGHPPARFWMTLALTRDNGSPVNPRRVLQSVRSETQLVGHAARLPAGRYLLTFGADPRNAASARYSLAWRSATMELPPEPA